MKILQVIISAIFTVISIILLVYLFAFSLIAALVLSAIIGLAFLVMMVKFKLAAKGGGYTYRRRESLKDGKKIVEAEFEVIDKNNENS